MKINISDIELDYLLRYGRSRKYSCLSGKWKIITILTTIYNILSSIERFEDLSTFKSLTIKEGRDGLYFIPIDCSDNIQLVLLLLGDVIELPSLIISENHE